MPNPTSQTLAAALGLAALGLTARAWAAPRAELSLAAGWDTAYDDNVYNGRGPDYVNRISPHAAGRLSSPRMTLEAVYDFGFWWYALGKARNSFNHRAHAGAAGRLSRRVGVRVADELVRAEDPAFLSRVGVVAPQIGIFDNLAEAGVDFQATRRLATALDYAYHRTWFDPYDPAQLAAGAPALFDGAQHDGRLSAAYRVTRHDDLLMAGRVQLFTAGPQHTSADRWNLGVAYAPGVGWAHHFGAALEATADAGPLIYQGLAERVNVPAAPGGGVTWRAGARLRYLSPTWRAILSYAHDLFGATGIGSAIWADHLYGQVGYHYLERLDAHVGAGYFRNGRALDEPLAYDGVTVDTLVDVSLVRNLRIGAYYTLRWQHTGPGAVPPGADAAQFPNVLRNVVGLRLLAVVGAEARPPRREVHE